MLQPEEVFVTDGFPEHSYVKIDNGRTEQELQEGLAQKNKIISISGPSKSGKSTLCNNLFGTTIGSDKLYVTGDSVQSADDLWAAAYRQVSDDSEKSFHELSYAAVLDRLVEEDLPLIVDDFHYIPALAQHLLCRQFKNAASAGLRLIVLSTPHRGDDPIRSNADLSGRYFSVNFPFWRMDDLVRIAELGFPKLGFSSSPSFNQALAEESLRSPQIMQTLCLEVCRSIPVDTPFEHVAPHTLSLDAVKRRALRSYNMSTALHLLINGPPQRGSRRLKFSLSNGLRADVYEILVAVLRRDPPFERLSLDDIKSRVASIVSDKRDPNIRGALQQIEKIYKDGPRPLEWDDEKRQLTIADPHFYFYLRNHVAN